MAVIALIMPVLMLGVLMALGRYEELLLPGEPDPEGLEPVPVPLASSRTPARTPGGGGERAA